MKIEFNPDPDFQADVVSSIVDLFEEGQGDVLHLISSEKQL